MEELQQIVQQLQVMAETDGNLVESCKMLQEQLQIQRQDIQWLQDRVSYLEKVCKVDQV